MVSWLHIAAIILLAGDSVSNAKSNFVDAQNESTTQSPVTVTSSAATTSSPQLPKVSYAVENKNSSTYCIVLNGTVKFDLPYVTSSGLANAQFYLPASGSTDESTCYGAWANEQGQLLQVTNFYQDWKFELFFENAIVANANRFAATQLRLHYSVSHSVLFPNATGELPYKASVAFNGSFANPVLTAATVPGYYFCRSESSVALHASLALANASSSAKGSVTFKELTILAFGQMNSTAATGLKTQCFADFDEISFFLPTILGCALAALLLIVLIAFIIGHRRSRFGYERV